MLEKVIELLAWPAAFVVLGGLIGLIFRAPLADLIKRIRSVQVGQNAIDATGDAPKAIIAQQKETTPAAPETVPATHAMRFRVQCTLPLKMLSGKT
jgi:hypothetical protein